jgi:hypothetical protein
MPYNSAQATKGITVQAITVTLEVSPAAPWTAGQTVTLKATVKKDGAAWSGATVDFLFYPYPSSSSIYAVIGTKTTDTSGVASISYSIPWQITIDTTTWTIPCRVDGFGAREASTGTVSSMVTGQVAYPTRLSISAPDTVLPNQAFAITGKLEYQRLSGTWDPIVNRTVSLYYNGTKIADVTTGSDGSYNKPDAKIPTGGTYTLKALFAGEGFAAAAAFLGLTVSPETKAAIQVALPLLTGAIVAFASLKAKR